MGKKVTIIGAGKIGTAIAHLLGTSWYDITIVDEQNAALKKLEEKNYRLRQSSVYDHEKLATILNGQDIVINAGPFNINEQIATVAADFEVSYFDMTEDVEQAAKVKKIAKRIKYAVSVPQCGLAPGFISIITNHLAKGFDKIVDVKMRVGALPVHPNNHLKYNLTWSVDGLINEYLKPCNAIRNSKLATIDPLEGHETFSLDGVQYEAFNTSGGLGTLCETWKGKIRNMDYKSIRYPGHRDLIKFLIDDLNLDKDNGATLKSLLSESVPSTDQDVVIIFVSVSGYKDGRLVQETWSKKIYGADYFGEYFSAIQLATAAGVIGMVGLHGTNEMPEGSFIRQEDVNFDEFMRGEIVGTVYGDH